MTTAEKIKQLREQHHMTQDELADKLFITRQAVSRWETGETMPGIESLKILSSHFGVSINTLLGSPRQLVCQCCGMSLEDDATISREADNSLNEDYCKWCYEAGNFAYADIESLVDYLTNAFSDASFPPEQARRYFTDKLQALAHWQQ